MRYLHVFFDLDHTLWDFDTNARESLFELYEQLHLRDAGVADVEAFYRHYLHHNQVLWDRYHHGGISSEELKWKRMWRTLLEFKIADEALARRMSETFLEILPHKRHLFPYTIEILEYLRAKGYRLHLITNGFEQVQRRKLASSHLDGYFETLITSERSGSVKPNPAIFEYALKTTGARLDESIMIGDNPDADIGGARSAGMDCIFVNHARLGEAVPATHVILHLRELEQIL